MEKCFAVCPTTIFVTGAKSLFEAAASTMYVPEKFGGAAANSATDDVRNTNSFTAASFNDTRSQHVAHHGGYASDYVFFGRGQSAASDHFSSVQVGTLFPPSSGLKG